LFNLINHLEKWTTPDSRNTPPTTNLEEEETVTPQVTMAMCRCWNRSNNLIHEDDDDDDDELDTALLFFYFINNKLSK